MFWLFMVVSFWAALLLQLQLPVVGWGSMGGRLPLVSAVVLYYVLTRKLWAGFVAVVVGGLLLDGFSLMPPGSALLVYALALFLAERYRQLLVPEAGITALVFGAGVGAVGVLLRFGLLWQAGFARFQPFHLLLRILFAMLAGGIVTAMGSLLLQRLHAALDLADHAKEDRHVLS